MNGFQPIITAPRDGTPIEVAADGMMAAVMRWNPKLVGPLGGDPGCWVALDESFVWSEWRGAGPTHWRRVQ